MTHILKDSLRDCSGPDGFSFSLRCELCGELWESGRTAFSKAGSRPGTEGEKIIYDVLYRREKEAAREEAVRQAEQSFSRCPICRRLVCDRCFMLCDNLDMCVSCAGKLQEQGEPVI